MSKRLLELGMVVLMAGAGLALATPRVQAQEDPNWEGDESTDLDTVSDEDLDLTLGDELDDIYTQFDPQTAYSLDALHAAIMVALSDVGDDEDPEESAVGLADLEGEMAEFETTVSDVVAEALGQADELACWRGPSLRRNAAAWALLDSCTFRRGEPGSPAPVQDRARRNGATKPAAANAQVIRMLKSVIRAKR